MTIRKVLRAIGVTTAVGGMIALGLTVGAGAASAHTPDASITCTTWTIGGANYQTDQDNTAAWSVDGSPVQRAHFGAEFRASGTFPANSGNHTLVGHVWQNNDPNAEFSKSYNLATEGCPSLTMVQPVAPTVTAGVCTDGTASLMTVTLPSTKGITYTVSPVVRAHGVDTATVTATADKGYSFYGQSPNGWKVKGHTATLTVWKAIPECGATPPATTPPAVIIPPVVTPPVVTPPVTPPVVPPVVTPPVTVPVVTPPTVPVTIPAVIIPPKVSTTAPAPTTTTARPSTVAPAAPAKRHPVAAAVAAPPAPPAPPAAAAAAPAAAPFQLLPGATGDGPAPLAYTGMSTGAIIGLSAASLVLLLGGAALMFTARRRTQR